MSQSPKTLTSSLVNAVSEMTRIRENPDTRLNDNYRLLKVQALYTIRELHSIFKKRGLEGSLLFDLLKVKEAVESGNVDGSMIVACTEIASKVRSAIS